MSQAPRCINPRRRPAALRGGSAASLHASTPTGGAQSFDPKDWPPPELLKKSAPKSRNDVTTHRAILLPLLKAAALSLLAALCCAAASAQQIPEAKLTPD